MPGVTSAFYSGILRVTVKSGHTRVKGSLGILVDLNHIAVKAYQVPTCTGPRSPILLRLVCGRTPVATLGMWADPGRALSVGSGAKRRVGSDTGKHTRKNYCNHE